MSDQSLSVGDPVADFTPIRRARPRRSVTYVIDSQGIVRHIFNSKLPTRKHVEEALRLVRSLRRNASAPPSATSAAPGHESRV